jgi:hypothetical protein
MNDRELLEMAAKAAGNGAEWYSGIGMGLDNGTSVPTFWNPLGSDADAFRLAVKLGLLDRATFPPAVAYEAATNGGDWYAATRRAIVRAAAEIGRNQQ